MPEHMLDRFAERGGFTVAICCCGWETPPCPGADDAANFWGQHLVGYYTNREGVDVGLNDYRDEVHAVARGKGWWESEDQNFGEVVALCHSELSEALEEVRSGHPPTETYFTGDKPQGVPTELADVLVRVLDAAGYYGIDIEGAFRAKVDYNRGRDHRHGGKAF